MGGFSFSETERFLMHIEVKLFANLRKNLPPSSIGSKGQLSLDDGATIQTLITFLNIPVELAQILTRCSSMENKSASSIANLPTETRSVSSRQWREDWGKYMCRYEECRAARRG
jgi:hypothetical protein